MTGRIQHDTLDHTLVMVMIGARPSWSIDSQHVDVILIVVVEVQCLDYDPRVDVAVVVAAADQSMISFSSSLLF